MVALLLGTWACAGPPASPPSAPRVDTPSLRWGGDAEGGTPFVEADAADPARVRGFDVEIATMIAQGLGRAPQFVQVAWASIEQSVARGDFAIGMSGLEDRPALHERFAVSLPYYEFREVLAVRAADSARFHTLADLRGRRVATLGATMAWEMLLAANSAHGVLPVSYDDDVHPYSDYTNRLTSSGVSCTWAVKWTNVVIEIRYLRQLDGSYRGNLTMTGRKQGKGSGGPCRDTDVTVNQSHQFAATGSALNVRFVAYEGGGTEYFTLSTGNLNPGRPHDAVGATSVGGLQVEYTGAGRSGGTSIFVLVISNDG